MAFIICIRLLLLCKFTILPASNNPKVISLVSMGWECGHGSTTSSVQGLTDWNQGVGQPAVLIWNLGSSSRLVQVDNRIQLLKDGGIQGPVSSWAVMKHFSQLLQAPSEPSHIWPSQNMVVYFSKASKTISNLLRRLIEHEIITRVTVSLPLPYNLTYSHSHTHPTTLHPRIGYYIGHAYRRLV